MTNKDAMPFGKHKGVPIKDVPQAYKDWLCSQEGFAEKNPILYKLFTEGESAVATPKELTNLAEAEAILKTCPSTFVVWWNYAYGERLRKDGETIYISFLRVARAAWLASAECHRLATLPVQDNSPVNPDEKGESYEF